MINILLVDDHPSVVEGTKMLIESEPDMKVTIATNATVATQCIREQSFDVMIFDLYMPDLSGLDLTKQVLTIHPDAIILIYTGYDLSPHYNILIESGVTGFVSKTATKDQLITAIRCALRHESIIPVSLLRELRRIGVTVTEEERQIEKTLFNEKELKILHELARGKNNRDISADLLVSQRSLEYTLTQLFQKLNVRSRMEAVIKAKQLGLIYEETT